MASLTKVEADRLRVPSTGMRQNAPLSMDKTLSSQEAMVNWNSLA
jgi:hypothetical protein